MFNLLEEIVCDQYGLDTWDSLLEEAQDEGVYSSIGSYPDEELIRLLNTTASKLGIANREILTWYGRNAFPFMSKMFSKLLNEYNDIHDFLLDLNEIIHPEVRKLYPDASVPVFEYEVLSKTETVLIYSSRKKMCKFSEGLIEGAAMHYNTAVHIFQPECMLLGSNCCRIHVRS